MTSSWWDVIMLANNALRTIHSYIHRAITERCGCRADEARSFRGHQVAACRRFNLTTLTRIPWSNCSKELWNACIGWLDCRTKAILWSPFCSYRSPNSYIWRYVVKRFSEIWRYLTAGIARLVEQALSLTRATRCTHSAHAKIISCSPRLKRVGGYTAGCAVKHGGSGSRQLAVQLVELTFCCWEWSIRVLFP